MFAGLMINVLTGLHVLVGKAKLHSFHILNLKKVEIIYLVRKCLAIIDEMLPVSIQQTKIIWLVDLLII